MQNMIVIEEDKKKIEKIKKKYKNLAMDDATASKINKLEITNKLLNSAMVLAGFATVIDFVIPDPILGLDEATLVAITTALKIVRIQIKKHINDLAISGETEIKQEDVVDLSKKLINIAENIKSNRKNR